MTISAQLRDCHSCYDERSMVQKKAQKHRFAQLQLVFPAETGVLDPLFQQIRREEELLPFQYRNRGIKEVRARGTKRRKQDVETSG